MRGLFLLLSLFLFKSHYGQAIPNDVKKTVAFIYSEHSEQLKDSLIPQGTGFFVGIPDTITKRTAVYCVTAKHVLKKNKKFLKRVHLRINKKDSLSEIRHINLSYYGNEKNVFFHEDETVDIAVISAAPDPDTFDYIVLTEEYLTNRESFEKLNIREGSDVFFTGMFTPYLGEKRNYPIVRFGRVALLTDEKIQWEKNVLTELYLIESSTYGGNSGSPVFFYLGADRGGGGLVIGRPIIKLAGVMKGFFGENAPIRIIETAKTPVSHRNLGIAAVVPSYFLVEILFRPELVSLRGF